MKLALVATFFVGAIVTAYAVQNSNVLFSPRATDSNPKQEVLVGPEEQVFTTNKEHIPDIPYITVKSNSGLIGVFSIGGFASQRAYKVPNPMGSNLGPLTPIEGIVKGTNRDNLDWGGVWLAATYREPNSNVIHGIYHSETHFGTASPNLTNDRWTAAYIRSDNGGQTWYKPNYPNNLLITAVDYPQGDGVSPDSLIPVGNDVYLYYFENMQTKYRGMSVAKAPISQIANPSSWKKYYCAPQGTCGFTEPGIGGKSTKLATLQGKGPVAYNTYLKKFIAVNGEALLFNNTIQLSSSSDGVNFTKYGPATNIGPSIAPDWVKAYSSLIGTNGVTSETGQSFYFYYVAMKWNRITQITSDPNKYVMRRKITLSDSSVTPKSNFTALTKFYNPALKAHIYTTSSQDAQQIINIGSNNQGTCCKLLDTQIGTSVPLYRVDNVTDYFMEAKSAQIEIAENAGYTNKILLGYCYPRDKRPAGTLPLYRLYNPKDTDHMYTTSKTERDTLTKSGNWKAEGVTCYVEAN